MAAETVSLYPSYTEGEVNNLFFHIFLDRRARAIATLNQSGLHEDQAGKLRILTEMMQHALTRIPFENLSLHYSSVKTVNIDHNVVLSKVLSVIEDGSGGFSISGMRGGYCMENNTLFAAVLRSVGFRVRSVMGRVFENGQWTAFSHMVNLVRLGKTLYQVDIGFGSTGPTRPIPLPDKHSKTVSEVHEQISPAVVRLVWRDPKMYVAEASRKLTHANIANAQINESSPTYNPATEDDAESDETTKMWIYEWAKSYDKSKPEETEWSPVYCFSESEAFPTDFEVMNMGPSLRPNTIFTHKVMAVRFVSGQEVEVLTEGKNTVDRQDYDDIVGQLILVDANVKLRVHGEDIALPFPETKAEGSGYELASEGERVEALSRYFDIQLSDEQQQAIRGTKVEIK